MAANDGGGIAADRPRGFDVVVVAHAEHGAAAYAREGRHAGDAYGENHALQPGPHDGRQHQRQHQAGEGQQHVHAAHQDGVQPALEIAGQQAKAHSTKGGDSDGGKGDQQAQL